LNWLFSPWGATEAHNYHLPYSFTEGWLWAERKWSKISRDTGAGNPRLATREKGERFFKDVTKKVGEALYDLSKADIENLYE